MTLKHLQKLAETFRDTAADRAATRQLADAAVAAHPDDADVKTLCDNLKAARDEAAVIVILDEVKARTA